MKLEHLLCELATITSAKVNGVAIDPQKALDKLRKEFDANMNGGPELVCEIERNSLVQRWKFQNGEGRLLSSVEEDNTLRNSNPTPIL